MTTPRHILPKGLNLDGCWCPITRLRRLRNFPDKKDDSELIELLGGPSYPCMNRSMASARTEVQAFFDEHGRRPCKKELVGLNSWLHSQTPRSSLYRLANEMGIPGGPVMTRTMASAKKELQTFFDEHGRRPYKNECVALNGWLRRHIPKSSVYLLANEIGLPGGRNTNRTMDSARAEIQEFFHEHGRRPGVLDLPALNSWLRLQNPKSSINQLANEGGLPGGHNTSRTVGSARAEIQEFFHEHGRRPTKRDLRKLDNWLRYQTPKSSIRLLANEMGLPGGRTVGRSTASARAEIQAHYDEHGQRPSRRDLNALDNWLRNQTPKSSVSILADEMSLLRSAP